LALSVVAADIDPQHRLRCIFGGLSLLFGSDLCGFGV
jgi:hypothetical protein